MSDFYVSKSEILCLFRTLLNILVVAKNICKTGKYLETVGKI
jgi:hypothetical protein